jgi:hypothetical protein
LWRQAIDRTGKEILSVDKGHFNDKTEAVVTISASRALLSTESLVSKVIEKYPTGNLLSSTTDFSVILFPFSSFFTRSVTGILRTT